MRVSQRRRGRGTADEQQRQLNRNGICCLKRIPNTTLYMYVYVCICVVDERRETSIRVYEHRSTRIVASRNYGWSVKPFRTVGSVNTYLRSNWQFPIANLFRAKFDYSDDLTRARRLQMRSDILKDTAALEQPRCSRARDFLRPVLPNLGGRRKRLFIAKHYSINNHFLPNTSIRRVKILHA